ncbi:MAG: hypothetical protein II580_03245, partial [Bacteroidales bacterium]|nr:hypothetical protein [Bacteroidales bacterium]
MLQKKGKYRGKVYAGLYAGDGKGTQQRIQWQLNYYIAKAFGIKDHAHTKADGHYACPNCGAILEIGEDGYYCCPSCSWTEMDFWEQELDEIPSPIPKIPTNQTPTPAAMKAAAETMALRQITLPTPYRNNGRSFYSSYLLHTMVGCFRQ